MKKKIKGWAVVPKSEYAKKVNVFYRGIKVDYFGALMNPQYSIFPKNQKRHAERNCNGYEKVIPVTLIFTLPKGKK